MQAISALCHKYPRKHSVMMTFLSNMLRDDVGSSLRFNIGSCSLKFPRLLLNTTTVFLLLLFLTHFFMVCIIIFFFDVVMHIFNVS